MAARHVLLQCARSAHCKLARVRVAAPPLGENQGPLMIKIVHKPFDFLRVGYGNVLPKWTRCFVPTGNDVEVGSGANVPIRARLREIYFPTNGNLSCGRRFQQVRYLLEKNPTSTVRVESQTRVAENLKRVVTWNASSIFAIAPQRCGSLTKTFRSTVVPWYFFQSRGIS